MHGCRVACTLLTSAVQGTQYQVTIVSCMQLEWKRNPGVGPNTMAAQMRQRGRPRQLNHPTVQTNSGSLAPVTFRFSSQPASFSNIV